MFADSLVEMCLNLRRISTKPQQRTNPTVRHDLAKTAAVAGARAEVKGAYLRVEIAARQYNPHLLTYGLRRTLAGWRERPWAFPSCLTASDKSLGGV